MINNDLIQQALRTEPEHLGLPADYRLRPQFTLHAFDEIDSTSQTLWQLAESGSGAGTAVIAAQQRAGRGQRGRTWQSKAGGLYLSVLLEPEIAIADGTLLTFCTAWGLVDVLQRLAIPVELKWPNDLVIGKQKLGGILTETRSTQNLITQAIVGVGINWHNSVPDTAITLQDVLTHQPAPRIYSLEQLTAIALRGIFYGYHCWQQRGTEWLMTAYQHRLRSMQQAVEINGHSGTVIGVLPTGELQIQLNLSPDLSQNPSQDQFQRMDQPDESTIILREPGTIQLGYC